MIIDEITEALYNKTLAKYRMCAENEKLMKEYYKENIQFTIDMYLDKKSNK